ncbi:MAG: DUF348 domain-containing protein [Tissierellia bacterium]|nr:DUF348 domain-containing protein [Tissierellia bacterium]
MVIGRIRLAKFKMILVLGAILAITLGASLLLSKEVKLTVENENMTVQTLDKTVGDVLKSNNIEIKSGMYLHPAPETVIEDGMEIIVAYAKSYTVVENGLKKNITSTSRTPSKILESAGYTLNELDYTHPSLNLIVTEGTTIELNRVVQETVVLEEAIPFATDVRKSDELYKGNRNVIQAGVEGKREFTISRTYLNGELLSEHTIDERVLEEPTIEIVEEGTKVSAGLEGKTVVKSMVMHATAYSMNEAGLSHKTASGIDLRQNSRVIAVDPKVIPLGTRVYVEGYGEAIAGDTGGAIKGNKIDVHLNSVNECYQWGRKNVTVHILG